jgi:hypothetical protein|tara:strand:- start:397 stop:819 length:423 start_codon:yes stop_codon:yes gene_type:complete
MNLSKAFLKSIRPKFQEKLDELGKELNLKFDLQNCSFTSNRCSWKIEMMTEGGKTKEQEDLETMSRVFGLDLDKEVEDRNHIFKLWGFKTRARKNPFIIEAINSFDMNTGEPKKFIISEEHAKRMFGVENKKGNLTQVAH